MREAPTVPAATQATSVADRSPVRPRTALLRMPKPAQKSDQAELGALRRLRKIWSSLIDSVAMFSKNPISPGCAGSARVVEFHRRPATLADRDRAGIDPTGS